MNDHDETSGAGTRPEPLPPASLYVTCDTEELDFDNTGEIEPLDTYHVQARAVEALRFGQKIPHAGYNMFLLGSTGVGKHGLLDDLLDDDVHPQGELSDWCYVNNFDAPHQPTVLRLPPGRGRSLRDDMEHCVEELLGSIPAAFQSDEYQARLQEIREELSEREQNAFQELGEKASREDIALLQTPSGYTLAPMKDGKIVAPKEFEEMPEDKRERVLKKIEELREDLKSIIRQIPAWTKESREKFRALNREISRLAIDQLFDELTRRHEDLPDVVRYLEAVKADVVENIDAFRQQENDSSVPENVRRRVTEFVAYSVNVLVDNAGTGPAPVVHEDNPTYVNLVGRAEHASQYGTLVTNFTMLKPGAFHRANGGYLVLDARKVLTSPMAWETLKRVLRAREIRIESLERAFSFVSTAQLDPEPIPLDVKVVLTGDRFLYYLLKQYDPEFGQLFKVAADMSEDIRRTAENTGLLARLVRTVQVRHGLEDFDRGAVARIVEHCARQIGDNRKLSLHMGALGDLMFESAYHAGERGAPQVTADDVQRAIDAGIRRMDQFRERSHESILRGVQRVDTQGRQVGQVNGLAVYQLGDYAFGRPARITATARLGSGGVVDIEREVELGGRIHSKAVKIISSFMASRYARNRPLPLSASLVFEQSYGGVEGDSASIAELTALLSALASIPVRQDLAVTGSIDQHGRVQAIGGVNEKIEGFFDICDARGLTGSQGVVIPAANVEHLMLRRDVVEAARMGRFAVFAVESVDEAMALLMDAEPGTEDARGEFAPDTINGRVMARVEELIALGKQYAAAKRAAGGEEESNDDDG
ncbi:MAG: ATP-dependent protease [Proteobacteria bacterium]|nr:MAG: ATP-dependent protease [Pseudomonadota bacterium]